MTPRCSRDLVMSVPTLAGTPGFSRVKSLLMVCHEIAAVGRLEEHVAREDRTRGSTGENISGSVRLVRYLGSRTGIGVTFCTWPVEI